MAQDDGINADLRASQKPSITVTRRHDRSFRMLLMHTFVRPFKHQIVKLPKKVFPAGSPQIQCHEKAAKTIECKERRVDDIYLYDLSSKQERRREKRPIKRMYYFCGGGWRSPPSSEHWALLAEMTNNLPDIAITLVSYPLAPNSPAPTTFPQLMKLYRTVMQDAEAAGEEVILAGDSAGGNIVLCLTVNALAEDVESGNELPCPKAIFAMSPSTDLRRANPDIKQVEKKDPLLRASFVVDTAKSWRGDWDPCDVRVSPLYADVTPLAKRGVKVHGITGRNDVLGPDAILFREKLNQAWVYGEWLDWDKQMHCFPLAFTFHFPESREGKDWTLDVLKRT
ncbi:hypothetical protein AC579_1529 [Lecanosticta acicola]|uniref:Alpha/beta hydrolase fold-3 domain-containing protein n=1 Tax=Lecanosticta acicola TaxID=111012 RepID=A0AAI9E975_9PEZI|nr:hypothetical protein AC579_1529 [Lecanosticta acicola]